MTKPRQYSGCRAWSIAMRWGLLATAGLLVAGCKEQDEIRKYQVPRTDAPEARWLGAIVPQPGETNWFFLLKGSPTEVARHVEAFDEFVKSLRIEDKEPTWKLPAGWHKREGGPKEIRFATIELGPKNAALELSVTKFGGDVLANVNRWRGMLSQAPVTEAELPDVTRELKVNELRIVIVDITGRLSPAARRPGR